MNKAILPVMAALTLASGAVAAAPANPLARDKVVLDLRRIDFATADGQQRLAIRMDQAARAVCGDGLSTIHLALAAQGRSCQADVKADIRARLEARIARADGAGAPVRLAAR